MSKLKAGNDELFDLIDILRSENLKTIHLYFIGKIHAIEIVRMEVNFDNQPDLWVVLDGGVKKVFGEEYHPCLCEFFRKLEARSDLEIDFPITNISLGEIFDCVILNNSMAELVDSILLKNKILNR